MVSQTWQIMLEQRPDLTGSVGSAADLSDALRRGSDLRLFLTTDTYMGSIAGSSAIAGDWSTNMTPTATG